MIAFESPARCDRCQAAGESCAQTRELICQVSAAKSFPRRFFRSLSFRFALLSASRHPVCSTAVAPLFVESSRNFPSSPKANPLKMSDNEQNAPKEEMEVENFDSVGAGAALWFPMQCSALRKGGVS